MKYCNGFYLVVCSRSNGFNSTNYIETFMSKPWIIYALYDPRVVPTLVRYVGLTTCGMGVRMCGHRQQAKLLRSHRDFWIASLIKEGVQPSHLILEEGLEESMNEAEIKWIDHYAGPHLTNHTAGGGGTSGHKQTPETIAKRKASLSNPDVKARISAAHLGKKKSPEAIAKTRAANLGIKRSVETKRKLSEYQNLPEVKEAHIARHKGKVMSAESRAKMSASQTGMKRSPEAIEKTRQSQIGRKMPEGALNKAWETRRRNQLLKGN